MTRRHQSRLARHDADTARIWTHLLPTFDSQVVGPCFEAAARYWTTHLADPATLGGYPDHVGPTTVVLDEEGETDVDVVVAAADAAVPSERTILALGEAKTGARITERHLRRLEDVRVAFGERASGARILLFGAQFARGLIAISQKRADVVLVDLERLYRGD